MLCKTIDAVLFAYVISIFLFTFRSGFNVITNVLAGCFVYLVLIDLLLRKRKVVIDRVILLVLLFISVCAFSYFAALDGTLVLTKVKTLLLNFIFLIALINYLNDYNKLLKMMKYFIFSGTAAAVYIILKSDFSVYSRLGKVLGNENDIAIIIGIALIFVIYFVFFERKYKYSSMGIVMIPTIMLTGSREGILIIIMTVFFMLIFLKENRNYERIRYIMIGMTIMAIVIVLAYKVPVLNHILWKRFVNLWRYITAKGTNEGSILQRALMTRFGIEIFLKRPFMGYGLNNYRVLFKAFSRVSMYSHNNFIELLVGTGVIGTLSFYLIYADVLRSLYLMLNSSERLPLVLFSLNAAIVTTGYFIVHYDSKHFFILLAMSSAICREIAPVPNNEQEQLYITVKQSKKGCEGM